MRFARTATSKCIRPCCEAGRCAVAMRGARLLSRRLRDSFGAKYSSAPAERGRRCTHDVDGDRRRDAAACPAVLHPAGYRGQGGGRRRQDGGGRDRREAARPQARSLDHLLQRPRRAVLPHGLPAVHRACRRRGDGRVRRPQVPLEGAERDRLRDRAPALPAEFRPGVHVDRQDRLCDRHSAHPSRPYRPVLPIYVNAYLPPQPTMERCYQFGQAVARTVTALGLQDRHPVERRHVAFPRHRPLFQPRTVVGPEAAGEARKPATSSR